MGEGRGPAPGARGTLKIGAPLCSPGLCAGCWSEGGRTSERCGRAGGAAFVEERGFPGWARVGGGRGPGEGSELAEGRVGVAGGREAALFCEESPALAIRGACGEMFSRPGGLLWGHRLGCLLNRGPFSVPT